MANPAETSTRKASTIMYTDIVGFSKKLIEDESRAFELLKTHDALIRVLTAKFDGKIIKSFGDSFITEFPNSVNAIRCAVEIQKRFWNFNREKNEFDTIKIRAGLHFGDVMIRHDDILGEGITIVSRIEALCEPNRIIISKEVYDQIKNQLPLKFYKIGAMNLRDVTRPVEIYEILIDSIPELSKPSASAQALLSNQEVESEIAHEAEEFREATRIEETKQRMQSIQIKEDDERKKKIILHYSRAEKYFELGELEKAEHELNEITKIDARQKEPEISQHKDDQETIIQRYLNKAKKQLELKNLDEAEEAVNEVFRIMPLHVGAQQILIQIEEARYLQEEEKRISQAEKVLEKASEEEQMIAKLLDKARGLLQEEKFTEADLTLHDVFLIDPNHSTARRLEETIRQAKQVKSELIQIQAEQEHEDQHYIKLAKLQSQLEERKGKIVLPANVSREPWYKILNYIAVFIIVVMASYFGIPKFLDWAIPKTASIAVLRFTNAPRDTSDLDLFDALPILLSEDFAGCDNLTVIYPSSSLLYIPEPSQLRKIASLLPVQYLLLGTIQENHGRYTILIRLLIPEEQKIAFVGTIEGKFSELNKMRTEIVQKVLEKMEIKSSLPEIVQPKNTNAFLKYLKGIRFTQYRSKEAMEIAKSNIQAAVKLDPSLGIAYGALSTISFSEYQQNKDSQLLKSATDYAKLALHYSPNIASAYRILAAYYRLTKNYDAALVSITQSLNLYPQNPETYRELVLLSIIAGKYEEAANYASNALKHDPKNEDSHFTMGLVQHLRRNYLSADSSYYQAQMLGMQDSLLTLNYIQNAWIGAQKFEKVIQYCQDMLRNMPNDYRYYYWIGRAHQISLNIDAGQIWFEEGLDIIRRILENTPDDAMAHAYAGLCYSRLGKFSEGEAEMSHAMQLDSISTQMLFLNANLYSMQKNKQKALDALNKALEQKYRFYELLNPDLSFISYDPEFMTTVTRKIEGK